MLDVGVIELDLAEIQKGSRIEINQLAQGRVILTDQIIAHTFIVIRHLKRPLHGLNLVEYMHSLHLQQIAVLLN
ncbi:hypothetical protein D3C79_1067190 [compost metagenome]